MKTSKKLLIATIMVLSLLLILAAPVLADPHGVVGDRINILAGTPLEYPAGERFHIYHASGTDTSLVAAGHMGFALQVDGNYVEPDFDYHFSTSARDGNPTTVFSGSTFNFPEGLPAGSHTFSGHWYTSCKNAGGTCDKTMDPVDFEFHELTVNFYDP